VMDAMLKMKKIEVAKLRAAHQGDDTERTASAAS